MKKLTPDKQFEILKEVEDVRKRCDQNTEYISDREIIWNKFQKEVIERLEGIETALKPISETYNLISKIPNWVKQLVVGFSVVLGIFATISGLIWGWIEFVKHK